MANHTTALRPGLHITLSGNMRKTGAHQLPCQSPHCSPSSGYLLTSSQPPSVYHTVCPLVSHLFPSPTPQPHQGQGTPSTQCLVNCAEWCTRRTHRCLSAPWRTTLPRPQQGPVLFLQEAFELAVPVPQCSSQAEALFPHSFLPEVCPEHPIYNWDQPPNTSALFPTSFFPKHLPSFPHTT